MYLWLTAVFGMECPEAPSPDPAAGFPKFPEIYVFPHEVLYKLRGGFV